jgi:hypothetical protein
LKASDEESQKPLINYEKTQSAHQDGDRRGGDDYGHCFRNGFSEIRFRPAG